MLVQREEKDLEERGRERENERKGIFCETHLSE
jgi:hypothetical protein